MTKYGNGGVAKSYKDWEKVGDPFRSNNFKLYINVKNPKDGSVKAVRWYTSAELYKMYPDEIVTADNKYFRTQKEVLGFEKGYITIFKNCDYEYLEWFQQSPCRFNRWFKWYLPSEYEMPEDMPKALIPIVLNWELVGGEDGKLYNDNKVAEVVDSLIYEPSISEYQGEIGDRLDIDVEVTHTAEFDGKYGKSTIHTFEDVDGNVYVWNTTAKSLPVGTMCHIKGTVKDHSVYRNTKQTILTRCLVKQFIQKFSEFGKPVLDCFLYGNCYWFAKVLYERFGGEIVYNDIENHFACRIDDLTYDISGIIDGENFVSWDKYQKEDTAHTIRIIRDCVL